MSYKLVKDFEGVRRLADGAFVPFANGNRDYEEYLNWLAAGNMPFPADEVGIMEELKFLSLENEQTIGLGENFIMAGVTLNNKSSLPLSITFIPLGTQPETTFEIVVPSKDSKSVPNILVRGGIEISKVSQLVSILFTKRNI